MSRPFRMEFSGAFYQVTSRRDQRGPISVTDYGRAEFLLTLARVVDLYGWRVHTWCQMTNHYHLLVETSAPNLCRGMLQLNGQYSAQFNRVLQSRSHAHRRARDSHRTHSPRTLTHLEGAMRPHGACPRIRASVQG